MQISNVLRTTALLAVATAQVGGQVTSERLLRAEEEPGNWLTYNRTYESQHHSPLDQIDRENVVDLELKWVFQAESLEKFEMTPLVVDDVIYAVQMPNDVVALDAVTGRRFWEYTHVMEGRINVCCGRINRGLAIPRRHPLHGNDRRQAGCPRCQDRRGRLSQGRLSTRPAATRLRTPPWW